MKKNLLFNIFLLTFLFLVYGCTNNQKSKSQDNNTTQATGDSTKNMKTGTFYADTENSKIEWIGKKPTGSHNGNIKIQKGFISTDENGNIIQGEFIFDMNTINCTDLEGKKKESIEGHLKDSDFFDTSKHPTASFVISKEEKGTIFGTLTIKGISQEISFNYNYISDLQLEAEILVDRTLFDIKYKSKSVFPDLGDHFINDYFKIILNPIIFK